MNFLKGTKLYSIFTGKCPVCHEGNMYVKRNPYLLTETLKMHERCSHCNTKFKIEPSFFYGAMYVSYAVGVAIAVAAFVISFLILGMERTATFFFIVGTLVLLLPVILRLSRNIWINFFLKFDRNKVTD
ncbi:DUF983 domain-containing protein [Constantimarinum furrinae]|uniref:DUF983 domain-containing protein n=1 Tax=Constantimarinum furrinae TaxID=2562285 RepID=A0A7G8PRT9_9FLAO|nr:DUF983 domain-containing protein [Constantimarinum furrinae]QNJ97055.1 hypothetical protein ALE3EI_0473 [Constantimarinum furrinae]